MRHISSLQRLASASLSSLLIVGTLIGQTANRSAWEHPDGTTHWYQAVSVPAGIDWAAANAAAAAAGGYLATITSDAENTAVFFLVHKPEYWSQDTTTGLQFGPWLGGVQPSGAKEPADGWMWSELESYGYTNWATGKPNNANSADRLHFLGSATKRDKEWSDLPSGTKLNGYVIEFSGPFSPRTLGLQRRDPDSMDGYTLIDPLWSGLIHLVDPRGRVVHTWTSQYRPGVSAYLRPNGNLLRCGNVGNPRFTAGGNGGIVEEFDWAGNPVWSYTYSTQNHCQHHDIELLPNGNILVLAWERQGYRECIAAGRNPDFLINGELWPEKIVEVKPRASGGGDIVWEWRVWDHLIQDFDPSKHNYGPVERHPERIDLNYVGVDGRNDWLHANGIDYNANLDQIMISVRSFDELWIIDHSTTTKEAAGRTGGRSGKGGELLYRWGNPATYRAGTSANRQLYRQHHTHWIEDGLPGAGNILVFNNGPGRTPPFSTVDEIVPPTPDSNGNYARTTAAWGPTATKWTYKAPVPTDFYGSFVSGAHRLLNGNTLICNGANGHSFEVRENGDVVWEYTNPVNAIKLSPVQGDIVTSNTMFRSPRYAPTYQAFNGRTLTPGDPLEGYNAILLVEGSSLRHRASIGTKVEFTLRSPADAGKVYQVGTSAQSGVTAVDFRFAQLGIDPLLFSSILGTNPFAFQKYAGTLDASGRAQAFLSIANNPALIGSDFYTVFVVLDPAVRIGFGTISNTVVVRAEI